jgi:hypothetical protein
VDACAKKRNIIGILFGNRYENGCTIAEAKLLRFLGEVVVPRGNHKKGRRDDGEVDELRMERIL